MIIAQWRVELTHLYLHIQLNVSESLLWIKCVLGSGEATGSRADNTVCPHGIHIFVGKRHHKQINETY